MMLNTWTKDVSEVTLAKNSLRSDRSVVEFSSFSRSTPFPYSATAHDWLRPEWPEATEPAVSVGVVDGIVDGGDEIRDARPDSDM